MAFDSLFVGVTGLEAYQNQIDVISNNIANVGTTGYKGQDVNFQDLLYQAQSFATAPTHTSGGVNGQDVGLGVKIGSIDTDFPQGGLQTTGVNTNLAINGDGFFILRAPNANSSPVYTRNGDFSLNANGLLYDPSSGMAVQGYTADANGTITQTGTPGDITIPLGLRSQAVGTGLNPNLKFGPTGDQVFDLAVGGNLDQTQWIKEAQGVQAGTAGTGGRRDDDDDLRLARQLAPGRAHLHARRQRRDRGRGRPAAGRRDGGSADAGRGFPRRGAHARRALEGLGLVPGRHDVRHDQPRRAGGRRAAPRRGRQRRGRLRVLRPVRPVRQHAPTIGSPARRPAAR